MNNMSPTRLSTAILLLILPSIIVSYNGEDINKCVPCVFQTTIIHPTNCSEYYYCAFSKLWEVHRCQGDKQFVTSKGWCTDPIPQCTYDGRVSNAAIPISEVLPTCKDGIMVEMSTSSLSPSTVALVETTTGKRGGNKDRRTTTILAVLLGLTFFILLTIVLVIFLVKRRQKLRRPRNFYSNIPQASSVRRNVRPPPTANAVYSSSGKWEDETIDSNVYEVPMSEEAGYMEIPERTSYYSEPDNGVRPPMPLPVVRDAATEGPYEHPGYAGQDVPKYTVTGCDDENSIGDYIHPDVNSSTENHTYATSENHGQTSPDALNVEDPYDYCLPESAHPTPSPSFRGDSEPLHHRPRTPLDSLPDSPPDSPPYYIDPIPDELLNRATHQYHTLEPLMKGNH